MKIRDKMTYEEFEKIITDNVKRNIELTEFLVRYYDVDKEVLEKAMDTI
jgi:hypothetical protein